MRKYTRIGTFLLALVMCLPMLTAQAESELPEEVADLFTVKAWAHYAIANQPDMPENKAFAVLQEESGYEAVLLVMRNTKSETNVLVLAEKLSAQADWKITMRNWGAVGQGDANVPQLAGLEDGRFVNILPDPQFDTNPAKVRYQPDLTGYPEPLKMAYQERNKGNTPP